MSCFSTPSKNMLSSLRLPDRGLPAHSRFYISPQLTDPRYRYALRRQQLLAKGVDPANLSVFGAAFTKGLSTSERVTNADVAVRLPESSGRTPFDRFPASRATRVDSHSPKDGWGTGLGRRRSPAKNRSCQLPMPFAPLG